MEIDIRDAVILFIGKRGCGKTELLKSLLMEHNRGFDKIVAICPTDFNGTYSKLIGEDNSIQEFKDEHLKAILDKMEKKNKGKVQKDEGFKRLLLILDDCIADIKPQKCPNLKKIVVAGRHYGISLLFTSQYIRSVPPVVRNNADYLLVGKVNAQSLAILNEEFNVELTKQQFLHMFQQAGVDYQFLVIKNHKGVFQYGLIRANDFR
jgi:hypothetical protein